jgi:hypothetical protein
MNSTLLGKYSVSLPPILRNAPIRSTCAPGIQTTHSAQRSWVAYSSGADGCLSDLMLHGSNVRVQCHNREHSEAEERYSGRVLRSVVGEFFKWHHGDR